MNDKSCYMLSSNRELKKTGCLCFVSQALRNITMTLTYQLLVWTLSVSLQLFKHGNKLLEHLSVLQEYYDHYILFKKLKINVDHKENCFRQFV